METLDSLGIIQSTKAFNQKYVRTKTKLLLVYAEGQLFSLIKYLIFMVKQLR